MAFPARFLQQLAGVIVASVLASCALAQSSTPDYVTEEFGTPPEIPQGALEPHVQEAVQVVAFKIFEEGQWGPDQSIALDQIAASGDPRLVWILADLLRFAPGAQLNNILAEASASLLEIKTPRQNPLGHCHRSPDRLGHSRTTRLSACQALHLHQYHPRLGTYLCGRGHRLAACLVGGRRDR